MNYNEFVDELSKNDELVKKENIGYVEQIKQFAEFVKTSGTKVRGNNG